MSDILVTDLIAALYIDAGQEADDTRAAQLRQDAEVLRDVWERSKYALAPTRDQMMVAVGNASLNLAESMDEVRRNVGEVHTYIQQNNTLVATLAEGWTAFRDELRDVIGEVRGEVAGIKKSQAATTRGVAKLNKRMAASEQDRADLRQGQIAQGQELAELRRVFDEYIAAVPLPRRNELVEKIETLWSEAHGDAE